MLWGKVPSNTVGKKYAILEDMTTNKVLALDEWSPEVKEYFEREKGKYKPPFRVRFGWVYIMLGTFLFIIGLFATLIVYLMIITNKR